MKYINYMAKGGMIVAQKIFDINDDEVSEDIYEWLLDYTPEDFELSEEDQFAIRSEDPERVIDIMNEHLTDYEVVSRYDDDLIRLKIIKKTIMKNDSYMADGGETMNQGVYPANFFDGPNPTNLYALMQLDIDTGYGILVDGRIYTINEAFKLADEFNENRDNYDK